MRITSSVLPVARLVGAAEVTAAKAATAKVDFIVIDGAGRYEPLKTMKAKEVSEAEGC